MNDMNKDDAPRSTTPTPTAPRSGSDPLSAAKTSTGTSVGSAGQPATPPRSGSDPLSAAKTSAGASVGNAGQPSTPYGQQAGSSGQSAPYAGRPQSTAGEASRQQTGTRQSSEFGSTVDSLREQASDAVDQASDWTREQYREGARQLDRARNQSMQQLRSAQGGIERFVAENPLMVGVMGLAAGLVVGALLPRTRQEDRAFGRWADEVRGQGMRYARDATQRGRDYVEERFAGDQDEDDWRPEEERRGPNRSSGPRYQNH